MSNCILESLKASNPHSYVDNFSGSGFLGDAKKLIKTNPMLSKKEIKTNITIDRYSDRKSKIIISWWATHFSKQTATAMKTVTVHFYFS